MHTATLYLFLLLFGAGEADNLHTVNTLRNQGDDYIAAKAFDSARVCFAKVINDTMYANAVDYLQLASCNLQLKDTAAFKKNLTHAIAKGGADSNLVRIYFRPNTEEDKVYLKQFTDTALPKYRAVFLTSVDTALMREIDDIVAFDQLVRTPEMIQSTNRPYIAALGRIIDSINYQRVSALIRQGRFPGYHNFGIGASKYDQVLMHIGDHNEAEWQFIFNFLKSEVRKGNIMSKQVAAIATRHYGNNKNCSYYGSKWRDVKDLCDCKAVDKYRKEIGLGTLAEESKRRKPVMPDCYIAE